MAKLTAAGRKKIKASNFAGPDRSYPIEDASHARNALARVSQHGSPELKAKVRAKVHAKYPGIGQKSAKQPHPKTNPGFYDTEPHAPSNKKATHPSSLPSPALGKAVPHMVPQHPGRFSGMGGPAHVMAHRPKGGTHGFGHSVVNRLGALRLSGHTGAHRLGKRS